MAGLSGAGGMGLKGGTVNPDISIEEAGSLFGAFTGITAMARGI